MSGRKLEPRVCAICGKGRGTVAFSVLLRWIAARSPALVPYPSGYAHPKCLRGARRKATNPPSWEG